MHFRCPFKAQKGSNRDGSSKPFPTHLLRRTPPSRLKIQYLIFARTILLAPRTVGLDTLEVAGSMIMSTPPKHRFKMLVSRNVWPDSGGSEGNPHSLRVLIHSHFKDTRITLTHLDYLALPSLALIRTCFNGRIRGPFPRSCPSFSGVST